ncbi:MAG: endonuclease/exonuclease/phosphatase family protein [Saprospiraceae bacterium]|nr:endonuclease/exonuclease/phosphatase family protein [Saprospiraceae bacterium]
MLFLFGAVGYILGLLSTQVNPKSFWPISYFGLAFPAFLLIILLFFFYWLFTKNKKFFFPLLLLIVGWQNVTSFFSVSPFTSKSPDNALKIMSYNVRNFELYHWEENDEKRDEIFDLIREENPDIVCFQEFYSGQNHTTTAGVAKALDMPYSYFEVGLTNKKNYSFGIAIFSKYPLTNKARIKLGTKGNLAQKADVIKGQDTLSLFNIHLASVRFSREDYSYIEELKDDATKAGKRSQTKQIANKLKDGTIKRSIQAHSVKARMEDSPYPVVVCGDFNDTPVSYAYQVLADNMQDTYQKTGFGVGHTFNDILPLFRIDYILVSPNFKVHNTKVIQKKISDHYPVITEVSLR